jgi:hypothetical protein
MNATFVPRRRRRQQQQPQIVSYAASISEDSAPPRTSTTTLPLLRRAGSSAYSSDVSLGSLNDNENKAMPPEDDDDDDEPLHSFDLPMLVDGFIHKSTVRKATMSLSTTTTIKPAQSSSWNVIFKSINHQFQGMTTNFTKSGLPWHGSECRSFFAGGTGALYGLPALFCCNNRLEQSMWIMQAMCSILADYVCVSRDSIIHGVDRIYATFNTAVTLWRAAQHSNGDMQSFLVLLFMSVLPLSCFVLAHRAKSQGNLKEWQWYHGMWHITGSLAVSFTLYVVYHCHSEE